MDFIPFSNIFDACHVLLRDFVSQSPQNSLAVEFSIKENEKCQPVKMKVQFCLLGLQGGNFTVKCYQLY